MNRKKIILILCLIGIAILIYSNLGIEIGTLRFGKQLDLRRPQNSNLKTSRFYKEYYSQDQIIVLNTWATWCKPCIEEIPILNNAKMKYEKSNIKFLSLSVDTDSIKLANFIREGKFKFKDITFDNIFFRDAIINTLEGKNPDNHIMIQSVPKTFIVNNGVVKNTIIGTLTEPKLNKLIEEELE